MDNHHNNDDDLRIVIDAKPKQDKIIEHKVKRTKISRVISALDFVWNLTTLIKRKK